MPLRCAGQWPGLGQMRALQGAGKCWTSGATAEPPAHSRLFDTWALLSERPGALVSFPERQSQACDDWILSKNRNRPWIEQKHA